MRLIYEQEVYGSDVDAETRCGHYHGSLDIIAIKFKCCRRWFPCFECHTAVAGHDAAVWAVEEFGEKAVLCGDCGHQLTIKEYMDCGSKCPSCRSNFNPGCANHFHLYFEST